MKTAQRWEALPEGHDMIRAYYDLTLQDRYRAVWLMSHKTYADLQVAEGYPSYFPASARILETPVRWVNQSGVSLCVRDMPVHLRVTPKVRRAA